MADGDKAAVPHEVYRLRGPGLQVSYERGRSKMTAEISDPVISDLSGEHAARSEEEVDTGLRVDAELRSDPPKKVVLELLLPTVQWVEIVGESVNVVAAATITRLVESVDEDRPHAWQTYDVIPLRGSVSMEV